MGFSLHIFVLRSTFDICRKGSVLIENDRDRETERQKDRETESGRETDRHTDRDTE